jgi:DNA mismatch repair ATPase MutS
MQPALTYQQRIDLFSKQLAQTEGHLKNLSVARLVCFVGISFTGWQYVATSFELIWILFVAALVIAFIASLVFYQKGKDGQALLQAIVKLNQKELKVVTLQIADFEDGEEFINDQHDFSGDLDVFGPSSLFQYLNRTGTYTGKQHLAATLQAPLMEPAKILAVQDAVKVSGEIDFRQHFTAHAQLADESKEDVKGIQQWLDAPMEFIHKKFLYIASWLMPLLVVLGIVYYAITGNYVYFLFCLMVNWCILLFNVKRVNAMHGLLSNKEKVLKKFATLLQMIKQGDWKGSSLLQQQQQTAAEADKALHQLAKISSQLDQRLNLLVGLVINSIMLYDLHCAFRLERWKERYKNKLGEWTGIIAQFETTNSIASFAYNHPGYTYPQITAEQGVKGTAIGHPLIPASESVMNDCSIGHGEQFLIITGSNMSGKSTFLRSVGVNWLLSMTGAPVCATSFSCSPLRIMTSMRIKDSIARHTSYFQAELLRLQQIIQVLKTGQPVFIILDEILKGTNSEDKLSGSQELIRHFLQYQCLGMIATHDLELGALEAENPEHIRNYCFESSLENGQLHFDYRMRPGIARNKNATFLMKQMGII